MPKGGKWDNTVHFFYLEGFYAHIYHSYASGEQPTKRRVQHRIDNQQDKNDVFRRDYCDITLHPPMALYQLNKSFNCYDFLKF